MALLCELAANMCYHSGLFTFLSRFYVGCILKIVSFYCRIICQIAKYIARMSNVIKCHYDWQFGWACPSPKYAQHQQLPEWAPVYLFDNTSKRFIYPCQVFFVFWFFFLDPFIIFFVYLHIRDRILVVMLRKLFLLSICFFFLAFDFVSGLQKLIFF